MREHDKVLLFVLGLISIFAIVLLTILNSEHKTCHARTCPNDMSPRLMEGVCVCVTEAK